MLKVTVNRNKDGSERYYILRQDHSSKVWARVPVAEIGFKFTSKAEAEEWIRKQKDFQNTRRARMERKQEWLNRNYEVTKLAEAFYDWHKTEAPNSFQQDRLYMTYVTEYFIGSKGLSNPNTWVNYRGQFKIWLLKDARGTRDNSQNLSYSTINHILKAYNNFMRYLREVNEIDEDQALSVVTYPQHLVGKRGWEDVITYEEFERVRAELQKDSPLVADFFTTAFHTGMRFSEILGLPMGYLYSGVPEGPVAEEILKSYPKIYGYIVLESQIRDDYISRNERNKIYRKPLKTKKKISAENARTIPITDKEAWNVLAALYLSQKVEFDKQTFGSHKDDYALFEGLNMAKANRALAAAYSTLMIARPKSFHCCRHSKATYLVGETRSYFLGRAIIGHKSDVFDDYVHIYAMIALKAKQSDNVIKIVI